MTDYYGHYRTLAQIRNVLKEIKAVDIQVSAGEENGVEIS
jgi:hypothetical protein